MGWGVTKMTPPIKDLLPRLSYPQKQVNLVGMVLKGKLLGVGCDQDDSSHQ